MSDNIIEACYSKFKKIVETRALFDDINEFLLLFSCGKDCSMMLDLFFRYYRENKMTQKLVIFSAPFPKHMYYTGDGRETDNFAQIKKYWQERNVSIQYEVPSFDDFEDDDKYGCKICKRSRKAVIDRFVNMFSRNVGIVTGFTIYDALAYLNMLLLTCNFDVDNIKTLPEPLKSTTTKMLHKMSLREHLPNGKYMIRPMLPFTEQEVKAYLEATHIPYLTTPCKISKYKFKRLYSYALDLYEDFPVTYEGMESFLKKCGIMLNDGGLSFEDVEGDNFFIDC